MRVTLDDKMFELDDRDVIIARSAVNSALDILQRASIKTHNEALFITSLLVMYEKSTSLLDTLGADYVSRVLQKHHLEMQSIERRKSDVQSS